MLSGPAMRPRAPPRGVPRGLGRPCGRRELRMAGLTCVVRLAGRTWRHVRRALPEASGRLEALVEAWRALRMEELAEAQELMRREEELRDELKESCFEPFLAVFRSFSAVSIVFRMCGRPANMEIRPTPGRRLRVRIQLWGLTMMWPES